jgi:hypothetical protein
LAYHDASWADGLSFGRGIFCQQLITSGGFFEPHVEGKKEK